jgi:hypothetical protein
MVFIERQLGEGATERPAEVGGNVAAGIVDGRLIVFGSTRGSP